MLLSSALPLLPPPPTSLLPPLNHSPDDPSFRGHGTHHSNPHGPQHASHSRRSKSTINPRGPLTTLSTDERQLAQRKLAIAMYGYSWLKPAGCSKTMLGRREEELEREEVERQLRDVEMQERMAVEADELERQAERQAEGDAAGMEERDLDDDVPDADGDGDAEEDDGWGGGLSEGDADHDHGMRDLDDDIPSAADQDESDVFSDDSHPGQHQQSSPQHDSWTYDTRRVPSTPSSAGDRPTVSTNIDTDAAASLRRIRAQARLQRQAGYQRRPGAPGSDYDVDERDAEAMALADEMLDEDEMGETSYTSGHQRHRDNYDDDNNMIDGGRDLDDSVPDADDDDGGEWEHTDSDEEMPPSSEQPALHELDSEADSVEEDEDQEMDISVLPNQHQYEQGRVRRSDGPQITRFSPSSSPSSSAAQPHQRHTPRRGAAGRVVSGNAAISSSASMTHSHQQQQLRRTREGSATAAAAAAAAASSSRSGNPSGSRPVSGVGGGSGGSRRDLRSQTHQTQQAQSLETPQAGVHGRAVGAGLPRTGTLLGTDSTFGMGMSTTAGSTITTALGEDFEGVDSLRRRPSHATHTQPETQGQPQMPGHGQVGPTTSRRGWLNPAAARRNLFGLSRTAATTSSTTATTTTGPAGNGVGGSNHNNNNSSGGLFTPEGLPSHSLPVPAARNRGGVGGVGGAGFLDSSPEQSPEPDGTAAGGTSPAGSQSPGRQTRSGRILAGFARRAGRGQQQGGGG